MRAVSPVPAARASLLSLPTIEENGPETKGQDALMTTGGRYNNSYYPGPPRVPRDDCFWTRITTALWTWTALLRQQ